MFADVQRLTSTLLPLPDVRVYSLFGIRVQTPLAFHYDTTHLGASIPLPSVTAWGDGDGVVPLSSLAGCIRLVWGKSTFCRLMHACASSVEQHRYSRRAVPLPLPEASHWGILRMPRAVQMVTTVAGWVDEAGVEQALLRDFWNTS